jgi:hypothetical protein
MVVDRCCARPGAAPASPLLGSRTVRCLPDVMSQRTSQNADRCWSDLADFLRACIKTSMARGDRFLAGRAIDRTRALKKPLAVARGLTLALSRGACVVIGADGSSAILGGTQRRDSRNRVATRSAATCSTRFTSPNCVSGKLLKSMSRCSNWRPRVASSTANRTSCSATLR